MSHPANGNGYPALSHRRDRGTAKRFELDDLRPELKVPEVRPFLLAYLALVSSRVRRVAGYRARGATAMSLLDLAINQHILTFEIIGGGTRQQSIVDSLEAPRQTVRDGLQRLEQAGLIVRDRAGLYHPTDVTGAMANAMFETDFRMVARMCEAFAVYRAAARTVTVLPGLAPAAGLPSRSTRRRAREGTVHPYVDSATWRPRRVTTACHHH